MSSKRCVNMFFKISMEEVKYCMLTFLFSALTLFALNQGVLDVDNPKVVLELGQNLTQRLTNEPTGTKEDIVNDLTDYYLFLNTAFRVEDNNYPLGKEILQKLKARGGPPFLRVKVDDKYLENKYEMGVVEVDHIHEVIADIKKIWAEIESGTIVPPEWENY